MHSVSTKQMDTSLRKGGFLVPFRNIGIRRPQDVRGALCTVWQLMHDSTRNARQHAIRGRDPAELTVSDPLGGRGPYSLTAFKVCPGVEWV